MQKILQNAEALLGTSTSLATAHLSRCQEVVSNLNQRSGKVWEVSETKDPKRRGPFCDEKVRFSKAVRVKAGGRGDDFPEAQRGIYCLIAHWVGFPVSHRRGCLWKQRRGCILSWSGVKLRQDIYDCRRGWSSLHRSSEMAKGLRRRTDEGGWGCEETGCVVAAESPGWTGFLWKEFAARERCVRVVGVWSGGWGVHRLHKAAIVLPGICNWA